MGNESSVSDDAVGIKRKNEGGSRRIKKKSSKRKVHNPLNKKKKKTSVKIKSRKFKKRTSMMMRMRIHSKTCIKREKI